MKFGYKTETLESPPYNEGDALYVPMNRTAFVAVLAIVTLLTLAASLPERFSGPIPKCWCGRRRSPVAWERWAWVCIWRFDFMEETGSILLVDDEPGLRTAVRAYLEDHGWRVTEAANAREGWQHLERSRPDLIVSDIMMPQVNGLEFLKQIRSDERFAAIPTVFLTARGMTGDRIVGYQAGVDAYLAKPFDPDELVAIVRNLLARRRANTAKPAIDDLASRLSEIKHLLEQNTGKPKSGLVVTPPPIQLEFTPREQSVLTLVVSGLMNKEIAKRLGTTIRNVEKYVSRLFSKTGTNSRTELVRYALQHGLVDPDRLET
jgi:DNA-binding NarL/FixJ family response regulator